MADRSSSPVVTDRHLRCVIFGAKPTWHILLEVILFSKRTPNVERENLRDIFFCKKKHGNGYQEDKTCWCLSRYLISNWQKHDKINSRNTKLKIDQIFFKNNFPFWQFTKLDNLTIRVPWYVFRRNKLVWQQEIWTSYPIGCMSGKFTYICHGSSKCR